LAVAYESVLRVYTEIPALYTRLQWSSIALCESAGRTILRRKLKQ